VKQHIGETISHYRILEEIGQGGMGVVYRAEDTQLRRMVALKFLPPELSREPEARDRFIQEAQTASSLQHNNICTVHDIGRTDDGQMFIVMDLYHGETLKERIERGPIPPGEAADIAIQIGQGLARAHERGVVHRDIKPANVFLTDDGTVKILDFGLAKLGAGGTLTRVGTTLGTVAYMSPEQARGDDADRRTDIWSLGVIFYQMLTARLPFSADHEQAVIYMIQNSDPLPAADLPAECRDILVKALQKDPAARYQQVGLFVEDLRMLRREAGAGKSAGGVRTTPMRPTRKLAPYVAGALLLILLAAAFLVLRRESGKPEAAAPTTHALRRLAVLPLTNLRSDPQTDFLGFALADQIIGNLAYVKTLLVRPASAIRKYQSAAVDLATAARELNVDLLLTGNYLKEADVIRLSLELVDIRTNDILWREAMQERYENAFKLQDTVARRVADGLRVHFSPEELSQMQADVPRNPLAYDYYLRGISCPVSDEGNQRAVSMFRSSIALDSTYAPSFNELGFRLHQIASYAPGQSGLVAEAESVLLKALASNDKSLKAYGNLASLYTDLGRTEEAYRMVRAVLAINPDSPEGHFSLGYLFRYTGFLDRAEQEMERALTLDPGNPRFRSIGITYLYLQKYEEALRGFDLDSASTFSLAWKGLTYLQMGQRERAIPYLNRVLQAEPGSRFGRFCEATKSFIEGRNDDLIANMRRREAEDAIDGEIWYNLSQSYGMINDTSGVTRSLRKAIEGGFFNYPLMLRDPNFRGVRGDPGFDRIVGMAREKYEAFRARNPELADAQ
jgi:serine/threonine-protein kinase